MKYILGIIYLLLGILEIAAQPSAYINVWRQAPLHIPNESSTDAPLMGNGDIGMCVGFEKGLLRYYLTKNDFWRLQSKAEHLSGPRVGGYIDLKIKGFENANFEAEQTLNNGATKCTIKQGTNQCQAYSWVAATQNMIITTLTASGKDSLEIMLTLDTPCNEVAQVEKGVIGKTRYLTRAFIKDTEISTQIAFALKTSNNNSNEEIILSPGESLTLFLAVESKFKKKNPLKHVLKEVGKMNISRSNRLWKEHNLWWQSYWNKSSFTLDDKVLMKAYYQGLYTMGACSRDKIFPPALFGWVTTDKPSWNGDYHLNYNFYAPFYGLYSANRIEQASGQETPLLDFMNRGRWYAQRVTGTRGILYPVGIGPIGIEVTRDFPVMQDNGYTLPEDVESGGLFYRQRSHALFGTVNMIQHWRHTYDLTYGKRIYPYLLAIADFWEDFLVFENGQYQIYNDADSEKSGFCKNPGMTIALLRNALDATIDLSKALSRDADRRDKWKDIINRLRPLPIWKHHGKYFLRGAEENEKGQQIYGISFSMIYPANGVTCDSDSLLLAAGINTIDAIQQWQHHNSTSSFYPAAVRMGYNVEKVWSELHKYALHTYPNGFQLDNPHGIENSCTVVNTLHEMSCMSVGNKIRLFSVWPKGVDASFNKIRTWGAFLVSASLKQETIYDVSIFSEKGKTCTIINPWKEKTVLLIRDGKPGEKLAGKELTFSTSVGESIRLIPQ